MANIPFGALPEFETRKPSKARLAFVVLFLLLLTVLAVVIGLYIKEKIRSSSSKQTKHTECPFNSSDICTSSACAISAAGRFRKASVQEGSVSPVSENSIKKT